MAETLFSKAGVAKLSKVARWYDKHISNLHRYRLRGDLKCLMIGGEWYVREDEWELFCNRGQSTTTRLDDRGARPRSEAQRRRDDAKAAARCEALGV